MANNWITNQGQTATITQTVTKRADIAGTVLNEISSNYEGIGAKLSNGWGTTISTTYSNSLGLAWDLSKYPEVNSVRIAAMGFVDQFYTIKYKNGQLHSTFESFAYDKDFGQEICLVYRW